jgi:NhaA family Na+:H+ antiporter
VILGLLTPVEAWIGPEGFVRIVPRHMQSLTQTVQQQPGDAHAFVSALRPLVHARREAVSPAESIIERLHPWVAFVIMPLFALANAGVSLGGISLEGAAATVALAVGAGLVVGKPLGIIGAVMLTRALGVVRLPTGLSTRHVVVLGLVAGIGFTMALFIAQLAFSAPALLGAAKVGVLVASVVAGMLGLLAGRLALATPQARAEGAISAAQAEASTDL